MENRQIVFDKTALAVTIVTGAFLYLLGKKRGREQMAAEKYVEGFNHGVLMQSKICEKIMEETKKEK